MNQTLTFSEKIKGEVVEIITSPHLLPAHVHTEREWGEDTTIIHGG